MPAMSGFWSMLTTALRTLFAPFPSPPTWPAGARKRELCIEFQELGLRLKSCGKPVLAGVTGVLRAAHITAIMGPSGGAGGRAGWLAGWPGGSLAWWKPGGWFGGREQRGASVLV